MLLIWDMFKFLFQIVAVSIIQWLASFVFLFFFVLTRFNYFFAAKSKIFTNLFTATSTSKCLKSVLTKSEISPSRSHSQDCRANRNFSLGSRDHLNCLRRVTSSCLLSEGEFDGLSKVFIQPISGQWSEKDEGWRTIKFRNMPNNHG